MQSVWGRVCRAERVKWSGVCGAECVGRSVWGRVCGAECMGQSVWGGVYGASVWGRVCGVECEGQSVCGGVYGEERVKWIVWSGICGVACVVSFCKVDVKVLLRMTIGNNISGKYEIQTYMVYT